MLRSLGIRGISVATLNGVWFLQKIESKGCIWGGSWYTSVRIFVGGMALCYARLMYIVHLYIHCYERK